MRRFLAILLVSTATGAGAAHADDGTTQMVSGFDSANGTPWFAFGVDYSYEARRAAIKREFSGLPGGSGIDGTFPTVKDLLFFEDKHTITPHMQIGIWHDVQFSVALPIVASLQRHYEFDQSSDPCVFPGGSQPATCINRTNSSTVIDGLLPDGSADGKMGYDASDPMTNFAPDGSMLFRSVDRSGFDQLVLGISWAPMNQDRDDTKPTWVVGAEARLSIGKLMKFNRFAPGSENGVSTGIHEFRAYSNISKRTSWAEPFINFWWRAPLGVRGDTPGDPNGSLFWNAGFGQKSAQPQQHAGVEFGFDGILLDHPQEKQRVSIELRGKIEAHFQGMGYSEMWEIFSYAGDVGNNPGGPLVVDPDPTKNTDQPISHPGVTTIENYMTFAGSLGVRAQIGPHARLHASFELQHDSTHAISFTEAGTDTNGDGVINPGTTEVNPLHKQIIDVVGRRYIVDDTMVYKVYLGGELLF